MTWNVFSLFSGIGGLELGLERAGMTTVGQVEIDPFCRSVLARHWPDVPRHDDVRTCRQWWLSEPRPPVDVVCGGYPCQPESLAGKGRSHEDERWLWPEMARVIYTLRPRWVIGENVVGHRTRGLRFVLRDLERLGYTARAGTLHACEVGASHSRPRLFTLAYANREHGAKGLAEIWQQGYSAVRPSGNGSDAFGSPEVWMENASRNAGSPDGVPGFVDRVRVLGNAVCPPVAEHIGRIVIDSDAQFRGTGAAVG